MAAPERITTAPPVETELVPAVSTTEPPSAESLEPATMDIDPDAPLLVAPVVTDTLPVANPLEAPVEIDNLPLAPDDPALEVERLRSPLAAAVLEPEAMITLPPVELVLCPATS